MTYPAAPIVGMRTDGSGTVDQVRVTCPFCRGIHVHAWHNEPDGLRAPTCGTAASYRITITTAARLDSMRAFATPDDVIGLVPLHIGYAYEVDGDDDVVGIVADTTLGRFAMWLALPAAVQLAGQLVDIAENRDELRAAYVGRLGVGPPAGRVLPA
jgi:hypothetical protein